MLEQVKRQKASSGIQTLFKVFPFLEQRLGYVCLGNYPTEVEPLAYLGTAKANASQLWIKREDVSSDIYGGNKIRPLEWLFAAAIRNGCDEICSTGSFGSNHAVATVLHARRAGLRSSVLLYPQPYSETARRNIEVSVSYADEIRVIPNWSCLPMGVFLKRRNDKAHSRSTYIMLPGGATPTGVLGYVAAAFELAEQVMAGEMPMPKRIVLPVGSTCTTAGLLLGTEIIARLGCSEQWSVPPDIVAVRVTPWPVTARRRIAFLSFRTSRYLYRLTGDPRVLIPYPKLLARLSVDSTQLGKGYGHPTEAGLKAMSRFPNLFLDTTYSAKAAAALIRIAERTSGCTLFWATKSSHPLPCVEQAKIEKAPGAILAWLEKGRRGLKRPVPGTGGPIEAM